MGAKRRYSLKWAKEQLDGEKFEESEEERNERLEQEKKNTNFRMNCLLMYAF
jgi:hypothetical protein